MPDIRMAVSKDSIKPPEPVEEDLYTFKVEGFKPDKSKNGQSINYNPILKIVSGESTGTKNAGRIVFENLNSSAGWVQHDFVHSLGLELEVAGDGLALPGKFIGDPTNPKGWAYQGPIVGKIGKMYVVKSSYNNKVNNKVKYYVCIVENCNTKYPDNPHSTNLAGS